MNMLKSVNQLTVAISLVVHVAYSGSSLLCHPESRYCNFCPSIFCLLFLHTDSEVCRETQPQLGAEGVPSPQHTGTAAQTLYFVLRAVGTTDK